MSVYDISKYSRNKYIVDLIQACEEVADINHQEIQSIDNCIITLADETTIDDYEKWFELENQSNLTLQDRIDRLIYTFNSIGFFTTEFLKKQAEIFTNGQIDVEEDFPNYHFTCRFTSLIGVPPNLDNFKRMILVNKPAHLTFDIKFRYRTHKELESYTHKQLSKYTHKELRERAILKGGM